jgi:hypothetical protein
MAASYWHIHDEVDGLILLCDKMKVVTVIIVSSVF